MDPTQSLLEQIEAYIAARGMSATAFGRAAVNDPGFVFKIRDGRELRRATRERVQSFLSEQSESAEAAQ
jgi:homoserine dehydrogenase